MRSSRRYHAPAGYFRRDGDSLFAAVRPREIAFDDDEFPPGVREMARPPKQLWVVGRDLRRLGSMVTVIGARRATQYGLSIARRLAGDLAAGGVCVVSGLARGCDAAAHDGALEAGGTTIAVLGSGADICYPAGSSALYAEIAARGAIVSANPPGFRPHKSDFVYRNDVMVAMSLAVVVVQGGTESAAVKTGMRAAGWGRGNVLAVPGAIDWAESAGVHALLKAGAECCTTAADVKAVVGGELRWAGAGLAPPPADLPAPQRRILTVLSRAPAGREQVVAESGLSAAEASRTITALEMAGFVVEEGFLLRRRR